jgi:hypothetical protein
MQSDHANEISVKSDWTSSMASVMDELTPSDLIGPKRYFAPVKAWLDSWAYGTPSVYPLVIVGDSGVGKSTVARAYAHEAGFDIIESHGDAERDVKHFNKVFSEARMPTFFGQDRCLIIEDAGAISNSAWRAFDEAIKAKAFPLIIIAQSESEVAWRYRKSGLTHEIPQPNESDLMTLLTSICPSSNESDSRLRWISQNASSWRTAKFLLQTTPPDWIDDSVEASDRQQTGFNEIASILRGEHSLERGIGSHPLGVISAAEWNCAAPESVCEAIRLHSLAWGVDGLSKVSMAYLSTLRANSQDKPPFRRRDIRGSTRRV